MKKIDIILFLVVLTAFAATSLAQGGYITPASPVFTDSERQTELAKRRSSVASKMSDGSVMILMSGMPRIYAGDVDYVFRQENDLYYLTALKQKDATLVIKKLNGKTEETLFIPKRVAAQETWTGHMYSDSEATELSGIKNIKPLSDLKSFLDSLRSGSERSVSSVYLLLPSDENDSDSIREFPAENKFSKELTNYKVVNAQPIFAELRLIKSPYEIKLLQHAIDITTEAQLRAMATAGNAKMEYETQAEIEYIFRKRNADYWGYPSIVGCGPNATTLHYEESQGPVSSGQLLLMDVGAEYDHYTADVTRTFPVNGKFTKEQAEIYQIVYDAQEAVAAAAKPGVEFGSLQMIASKKIGEGLFKLGLIPDKNSPLVRLYFMHGLGHWLGMNVHDVGSYDVTLKPGMVFTNEPGIYIRSDVLDNLPDTAEWNAYKTKVRPVFEKYKNIGVRIEDDMLVTANGVDWMTKRLPRSIADVETYISNSRKH